MIAEARISLREESPVDETNTCAPETTAEPDRAGETTTAGRVGLTVQQLFSTVALDMSIAAQQSFPVWCTCCRQIPAGAANAPINTMATAARWKTPCNMVSAYYGGWISR